MRQNRRKSDCPIHFALEIFGDRWTLLIIRDMVFTGRTAFTDFLQAPEHIATNILADRLARLEQDGIITKEPTTGTRGKYHLTQKGIDLLPLLLEIVEWGAQYDPETKADPKFVKRLRNDKTNLMNEIRARLQSEDE